MVDKESALSLKLSGKYRTNFLERVGAETSYNDNLLVGIFVEEYCRWIRETDQPSYDPNEAMRRATKMGWAVLADVASTNLALREDYCGTSRLGRRVVGGGNFSLP